MIGEIFTVALIGLALGLVYFGGRYDGERATRREIRRTYWAVVGSLAQGSPERRAMDRLYETTGPRP